MKTFSFTDQSGGIHDDHDEVSANDPTRVAALAAGVDYVRLVEQYRGDSAGLADALRQNIFATNIDPTAANPAPITTYDDAIDSAQDYADERNIPITLPDTQTIKETVVETWDNVVDSIKNLINTENEPTNEK